jgi:hypothetical protein
MALAAEAPGTGLAQAPRMAASAILLVGPQPQAMKQFLSQGGFVVDCASGKGEAYALLANNFYAAIIANLQALSTHDGLDLLETAH